MAITVILHNVLTPSGKKIAARQPVDAYRKLLQKQKIEFTEEESIFALAPEIDTGFPYTMHDRPFWAVDEHKTPDRGITIFRF